MAVVTSLTATRIQELLAGWESVGLSQDEINALIIQLATNVASQAAVVEDFTETTLPHLREDLEGAANTVSDLNDNVLPTLQSTLSEHDDQLEILNTVTLPSLQESLDATVTNVRESPKVYVQDDPPEDPDDDGRDLVVGDTWFDSNDENAHQIWDGAAWTTFKVDVADFSLTAQKFKTTTHMIY